LSAFFSVLAAGLASAAGFASAALAASSARALNETRAKAARAAAIVRIMNELQCGAGVSRWFPDLRRSKPRARVSGRRQTSGILRKDGLRRGASAEAESPDGLEF